jgi:hypothetical protein
MQLSMVENATGGFDVLNPSRHFVAAIEKTELDGRDAFWIQADIEVRDDAPTLIIGPYPSPADAFQVFSNWFLGAAVPLVITINDTVATERSDGSFSVRFRSSNRRLGVIRYADGSWLATHADFGPVGTFQSVREAMTVLWEED